MPSDVTPAVEESVDWPTEPGEWERPYPEGGALRVMFAWYVTPTRKRKGVLHAVAEFHNGEWSCVDNDDCPVKRWRRPSTPAAEVAELRAKLEAAESFGFEKQEFKFQSDRLREQLKYIRTALGISSIATAEEIAAAAVGTIRNVQSLTAENARLRDEAAEREAEVKRLEGGIAEYERRLSKAVPFLRDVAENCEPYCAVPNSDQGRNYHSIAYCLTQLTGSLYVGRDFKPVSPHAATEAESGEGIPNTIGTESDALAALDGAGEAFRDMADDYATKRAIARGSRSVERKDVMAAIAALKPTPTEPKPADVPERPAMLLAKPYDDSPWGWFGRWNQEYPLWRGEYGQWHSRKFAEVDRTRSDASALALYDNDLAARQEGEGT